MPKKKTSSTKTKPKKKAALAARKPKPLAKPQIVPGKIFNDPNRLTELTQQIGAIAERIERARRAAGYIGFIESYAQLLDADDRDYWNENRKDIWEIYEVGREAAYANMGPGDAPEQSKDEAGK